MSDLKINILKYLSFTIAVAFLTFIVFYGKIVTQGVPLKSEQNIVAPISDHRYISNKKSITRSRTSSVRVLSIDINEGMVATSSATYFKYKELYFVLTTSHGLVGGCETIQIEVDGELYDCLEEIAVDPIRDYAILKTEKIDSRKPIKYPVNVSNTLSEWKKTLTILNHVVYTGYPNSIGPLTIQGSIMGFDPSGIMYIQSYAWSGSSGSGVFDQSGNLIGYILAIDVGQTEYGTAILENVMLVVPIYEVDWSVITKKELTNVGK